jgi:hypothetical protein
MKNLRALAGERKQTAKYAHMEQPELNAFV